MGMFFIIHAGGLSPYLKHDFYFFPRRGFHFMKTKEMLDILESYSVAFTQKKCYAEEEA